MMALTAVRRRLARPWQPIADADDVLPTYLHHPDDHGSPVKDGSDRERAHRWQRWRRGAGPRRSAA